MSRAPSPKKARTALLAAGLLSASPALAQTSPADDIQRGAYLARAGDCVACHTTPGGKDMAGGLPFALPFGTIYSTNITPDAKTGIGTYRFEDFDRAMRKGVAADGRHLYPAMPYPSFAKLTEADMRALYAYFLKGVAPVDQPNRKNGVIWPLSMRWPLAIWDAGFAGKPFEADRTKDADWNRGAYLVEGLGHCGACHTPRGIGDQEKALDDRGALFLAGGPVVDGWIAPSLRGEAGTGLAGWNQQEIARLLKTGRTDHAAVFGSMTDVVRHSTQYLSDGDLQAIAKYLKSLPPTEDAPLARPVVADRTAAALRAGDLGRPGAAAYVDSCAACHRTDGMGYVGVFPRLAGNPAVLQKDPTALISVVLKGSTLPATAAAPSSFTMPPFGDRLSDQDAADIVNLIRNSWGNQAPPITDRDVKSVRGHMG
ncbi:MAG TPA: cytochrome c [Aliidongia sp.]|uniref:c-type cytochrome n=1 Tax=Aliidongia sp. TaxID=1914230 RepID=UPI002DDD7243|nr:cytochrome c [Aliidongia sp.]HEV2678417.1 cytochrome c [Aliidongia sp.]